MFTPEEMRLIHRYSADRGRFSRVSFYCAALFAPVLFAIYGTLQRDFVALLIAFLGLIAFVLWMLTADVRSGDLIRSVCRKLIAAGMAELKAP